MVSTATREQGCSDSGNIRRERNWSIITPLVMGKMMTAKMLDGSTVLHKIALYGRDLGTHPKVSVLAKHGSCCAASKCRRPAAYEAKTLCEAQDLVNRRPRIHRAERTIAVPRGCRKKTWQRQS